MSDQIRPRLMPLFPPVQMPPLPTTWESVERLALYHPTVRMILDMSERDGWTREQALATAVFVLADAHQKMFAAEVDRRMNEAPPPFVVYP